ERSPWRRNRRITVGVEKDLETRRAVLQDIGIRADLLRDILPCHEIVHETVDRVVVQNAAAESRHATGTLSYHLRDLVTRFARRDADQRRTARRTLEVVAVTARALRAEQRVVA